MIKQKFLYLLTILFLLSGIGTYFAQEKTIRPFFSYNFGGLENLKPAEQIALLKSKGYDGICLRMAKQVHEDALQEFIDIANKTPDFKIYSVFVRYNFKDAKYDRLRWKRVVNILEGNDINLWFIFGKYNNRTTEEEIENILRDVVSYADRKGINVTLYPHDNCYFYSAKQALPIVKKINHPRLKLALHTCHELKSGLGHLLGETVESVKDYLGVITIAGAAAEVDRRSGRTKDKTTIRPLEDNVFDFSPFYKALRKINYTGPVGFINFNFEKTPEEYLDKSLVEWKKIERKYFKSKK